MMLRRWTVFVLLGHSLSRSHCTANQLVVYCNTGLSIVIEILFWRMNCEVSYFYSFYFLFFASSFSVILCSIHSDADYCMVEHDVFPCIR